MKRLLITVACLVALAACGDAAQDETTTTSTTEPQTTTSVAPETTTTTEPATTTTTSGGSEGDLALLQEAMATSAEAGPSRIEGAMSLTLAEGETAEMPMTMLTDPESGDSAMTMDMAAMAAASGEEIPAEMAEMMGTMEVRQIGDTVYLRFPFFTAFLGAETEWVSMPAEEGTDVTDDMTSGATPNDPNTFLESFSETEGTVEELGSEEIRGIATTHYRMTVSEDWQEHLSEEELAELGEQGPLPDASFPIDLWVGDDDLVHRMSLEFSGDDLLGSEREEIEGMAMTFDFFDFGQSVTIEEPPADEVTDMSELSGPLGTFEQP